MKVFLMHADRDFVIAPELRDDILDAMLSGNPFALQSAIRADVAQTDTPSPATVSTRLVTEDLVLEQLFTAMSGGDPFLHETARRGLLTGLPDAASIHYRQDVLADVLAQPDVARRLYELTELAIEHERNPGTIFRPQQDPESLLSWSVKVLTLELDVLHALNSLASQHAGAFRSEGFRRFFTMVSTELGGEQLQQLGAELQRLSFERGIVTSATLGRGDRATAWQVHPVPERSWGWRAARNRRASSHSFDVSPLDTAGQRALAVVRSEALADIAQAAAQAVADIKAFFTSLRLELGFHLCALNLHDRLGASSPTSFPEPVDDPGALTSNGLREVQLSLELGRATVGNDLDAGGASLVVVTGANRGGKTTLLRSLGQAQLMMRAGMFVLADSMRASVGSGVFTHWTRGEDSSMRRGKLDEELSRMSQLADVLSPGGLLLCNESFASTNEREGSAIGTEVIGALLESGVTVVLVTHMRELARRLNEAHPDGSLFLHAQIGDGGVPTFTITPWDHTSGATDPEGYASRGETTEK